MKIRTAVVGVGHLGRFHAQKHKMLDDVEFDRRLRCQSRAGRKGFGREMGVEGFFGYPRALADPGKVDAVTVAASTPAHCELVKMFLESTRHSCVGRKADCLGQVRKMRPRSCVRSPRRLGLNFK